MTPLSKEYDSFGMDVGHSMLITKNEKYSPILPDFLYYKGR